MGEVSETTTTTMTTTKRKKKGRPSLLDLQKRSIKQQQKQHHHDNLDPPHSNNDDDVDERKLKKQKLLIGLNSHLQNPTTLLPNSNHTGSHQNVVVVVSTPFHSLYSSIQLLSNSHKPFQFSTTFNFPPSIAQLRCHLSTLLSNSNTVTISISKLDSFYYFIFLHFNFWNFAR
jgi:hypothetical protein